MKQQEPVKYTDKKTYKGTNWLFSSGRWSRWHQALTQIKMAADNIWHKCLLFPFKSTFHPHLSDCAVHAKMSHFWLFLCTPASVCVARVLSIQPYLFLHTVHWAVQTQAHLQQHTCPTWTQGDFIAGNTWDLCKHCSCLMLTGPKTRKSGMFDMCVYRSTTRMRN